MGREWRRTGVLLRKESCKIILVGAMCLDRSKERMRLVRGSLLKPDYAWEAVGAMDM